MIHSILSVDYSRFLKYLSNFLSTSFSESLCRWPVLLGSSGYHFYFLIVLYCYTMFSHYVPCHVVFSTCCADVHWLGDKHELLCFWPFGKVALTCLLFKGFYCWRELSLPSFYLLEQEELICSLLKGFQLPWKELTSHSFFIIWCREQSPACYSKGSGCLGGNWTSTQFLSFGALAFTC